MNENPLDIDQINKIINSLKDNIGNLIIEKAILESKLDSALTRILSLESDIDNSETIEDITS